MKLNPSNEAPLYGFKFALLKWVESAYTLQVQSWREYGRIEGGYQHAHVGFILQDQASHSIVMVCTIHTLKKIFVVWKGPNWEFFIIGLLDAKVTFKVVVCVCDRKSFKHLFTTILKSLFVTKVQFEFGHDMVGIIEGVSF